MPDLRQGCATGKSAEDTAPGDALVLFGAMGDLAHKKIFPALYPYGPAWSPGCTRDWRYQGRTDERTSQRARSREHPAVRRRDRSRSVGQTAELASLRRRRL